MTDQAKAPEPIPAADARAIPSPVTPSPWTGPPVPPALPRTRGRVTDTLTLALLCISTGSVALSATPALLRTAGLVRAAPPASPRTYLAPQDDVLDVPPPTPMFAPSDDDDAPTPELQRLLDRAKRSMQNLTRDPLEERAPEPPAIPRGARPEANGRALRGLRLRDFPRPSGDVIGEVRVGEPIAVVRELGEWAFVSRVGRNEGEPAISGWVKKSEIAVR